MGDPAIISLHLDPCSVCTFCQFYVCSAMQRVAADCPQQRTCLKSIELQRVARCRRTYGGDRSCGGGSAVQAGVYEL